LNHRGKNLTTKRAPEKEIKPVKKSFPPMETNETQMNRRAVASACASLPVGCHFALLGAAIGLRLGRDKDFCPAIKK
jgi:hypothetical protein